MKLSQINRAVEAAVLERFPFLKDQVTFDTVFDSASSMAIIFHTTVQVNDRGAYGALKAIETPAAHWEPDSTHILRSLMVYQADDENEFHLEGTRFMIGDGDDSGSVWEVGPWTMTMWVRILELEQGDYRNDPS